MQPIRVLQIDHHQISDTEMAEWPDEAIIKRILDKNGDQGPAFSILVARYHSWIFRRCLLRLGNHHDAEDATHDIVLRLNSNLHQVQEHSKFRGWLNTIINNYCNTFAVRRARYISDDNIEQRIELRDDEPMTDPYTAFAEDQMVRHALSRLPDNARQVLNLRFYAEYSLEEIANTLHVSLSAAKARLYRALELLRHTYELYEKGCTPNLNPVRYTA